MKGYGVNVHETITMNMSCLW